MVPGADRDGRLIRVVPEQAADPAQVLRQALRAVSRPELRVVSQGSAQRRELRAALPESLQPVEAPELALAPRRRALADAHRHAAASHHERRAQPEAHSADAVVQARSMAHRLAVSRSMVPVLRPELAESVVLFAQPEELSVQAEASAQPSELQQVEAAAQPSAAQAAVEVQPWAEPAEEEVQPSEVRVAEAVQPWEAQAAAEVLRAAEPAEEEVQPAEGRVAEAVQPSVAQAAVLAQPLEAVAERPSAEPSVRSDQQVALRLVRRRSTMSRREPEAARAEPQRSQSSSAKGNECSSWGLWGEKKAKQQESCRPSQRSELRSVDSD